MEKHMNCLCSGCHNHFVPTFEELGCGRRNVHYPCHYMAVSVLDGTPLCESCAEAALDAKLIEEVV